MCDLAASCQLTPMRWLEPDIRSLCPDSCSGLDPERWNLVWLYKREAEGGRNEKETFIFWYFFISTLCASMEQTSTPTDECTLLKITVGHQPLLYSVKAPNQCLGHSSVVNQTSDNDTAPMLARQLTENCVRQNILA